jgi:hypothetical protein
MGYVAKRRCSRLLSEHFHLLLPLRPIVFVMLHICLPTGLCEAAAPPASCTTAIDLCVIQIHITSLEFHPHSIISILTTVTFNIYPCQYKEKKSSKGGCEISSQNLKFPAPERKMSNTVNH